MKKVVHSASNVVTKQLRTGDDIYHGRKIVVQTEPTIVKGVVFIV
jgi:hypothetical protein